jgi:hypothetical protein
MTVTPWLADTLAATMLLMAAYMAGRLAFAVIRHRLTDHDVDGVHLVMGVAMAGMLVPRLDPVSLGAWKAAFIAAAAWFAVRIALALRDPGANRAAITHRLPTLVMCGAMLAMSVPPGSGTGAMGMGMSGAMTAAGRYPTLDLLLAVLLVGYAVMVTDRTAGLAPARPGGSVRGLLAPRSLNCCHIAMGVTMAYMLIAMV